MRVREKVGRKHGIIREGHSTQIGISTITGIRGNRIRVGEQSTRPEAQGIRGTMDPGIEDQSRGF